MSGRIGEHVRVLFRVRPKGENEWLVTTSFGGGARTLTAIELRLLKSCDRTATLDAFEGDFCAREGLAPGDRPIIRQALDKLVSQGLLIPVSRLLASLPAEDAAGDRGCGVTTVAIPTCGRPEQLKRLLTGLLEDDHVLERRPRILVIDDSRAEDVRAANLSLLRSLANGPFRISYADRDDRSRAARELSKASGVPEPVARYALLGDDSAKTTVGATRNAILLATLGEVIVSMDDDVRPSFIALHDSAPSLTVSGSDSQYVSRRLRSAEELAELSRGAPPLDFLGAFERVLGRKLQSILRSDWAGVRGPGFDSVNREIVECLGSAEARVALAFMGVAGNPGIAGRAQFLLCSGQKLASLTESRAVFERSLLQPLSVAGSNEYVVSRGGHAMMSVVGLDNRGALPPFLPAWVGEDDFFSAVYAGSRMDTLRAYLPYSMVHDPDRAARSWEQFWEGAASFDVNGLLIALLEQRLFGAGARGTRSSGDVGRALAGVADLGLSALEEATREIREKHLRSQYVRYEVHRERNRGKAPDFYQDALTELGARLRAALESPDLVIPSEFRGESVPVSMRRLQALIRATSELFQGWESLVEGARGLSPLAHRTL